MKSIILLSILLFGAFSRYCYKIEEIEDCNSDGEVCGLNDQLRVVQSYINECEACQDQRVYRVVKGICVADNIAPEDKGFLDVSSIYNDGDN